VDALTNRLGTRFLVVTVVPNVLLIAYVGLLLAAGAPTHSPSLARALKVLDGITLPQAIVILLALLIISVATQPLQTPLIQLVEGYWQGLPFGAALANRFTNRFRRELRWVQQEMERAEEGSKEKEWDWAAEQSYNEARQRQTWLPPIEEFLLPTALGNTLTIGEIRAGERYGLKLDVAMPRLTPLMSSGTLDELRDRRNQLDAAARLCVAAGLATAVGVGLLVWHENWLFLPVVTYLLCWMCYRAAVAAARAFSVSLAAAIDLHHLQLFDALQLERPASLVEEWDLNTKLDWLFRGTINQEVKDLRYVTSKTDKSSAELAEPPGAAAVHRSRPNILQRYSLTAPVAGLPEDSGGMLPCADRFLDSPRLPQSDPEVVQRLGLAVAVAGLAVDGGRVLVRSDRFVQPTHPPQGHAEVVQGVALAAPVAGLPEYGGGVLARGDRLPGPMHLQQSPPEVVQRVALAVPVAEPPGGVQADDRAGQQVFEPPPPSQVLSEQQREARHGLISAGVRRHPDRGGQALPFRVQPGQGIFLTGELLQHRHRWPPSQTVVSGLRHAQVVVDQPVTGLLTPVVLCVGVGELLRVPANQVVHPPPLPAARSSLDQVRPGEARKNPADLADRQVR